MEKEISVQGWKRKWEKLEREFIDEEQERNPVALREMRLEYLIERFAELTADIRLAQLRLKDPKASKEEKLVGWYLSNIPAKEKEINKIISKIMLILKYSEIVNENSLTEEMIEEARNYPIENLIEVDRSGFAFCPFHNDRQHPNLYTRRGIFKCYACGWRGNIIKFVMDREHLSFTEAVKYLYHRS